MLESFTLSFQPGLGQLFKLPSGNGIDFSKFDEEELVKGGDMEVFPLAVKAEASSLHSNGSEEANRNPKSINSQITQVVFEKEKVEYQVRVVKQILWVNVMRYEVRGTRYKRFTVLEIPLRVISMEMTLGKNVLSVSQNHGTQLSSPVGTWRKLTQPLVERSAGSQPIHSFCINQLHSSSSCSHWYGRLHPRNVSKQQVCQLKLKEG